MRLLFILLALLSPASALEIDSPQALNYNSTSLRLLITENGTSDSLSYGIDGTWKLACTNCTRHAENITLSTGAHTLWAISLVNGTVREARVNFSVKLQPASPPPTAQPSQFHLNLTSSTNRTYTTRNITVSIISDRRLHAISWIFNGTYKLLCEQCSSYNATLSVEPGHYSLLATGWLFNRTSEQRVSFQVVDLSTDTFTIAFASPLARTYPDGILDLHIRANTTLERMVLHDGTEPLELCLNCSEFTGLLNLTPGTYTLIAQGRLLNKTRNASVTLAVAGNQSRNATNYPDFAKLPQAFESGEISDAQLAAILRGTRLPPGILNRLVKSGKLGEESLRAMTEAQAAPPGLLRKILLAIGLAKEEPYLESLLDTYELSPAHNVKLLERSDAPDEVKTRIQSDLSRKKKIKAEPLEKKVPPGLAKKDV